MTESSAQYPEPRPEGTRSSLHAIPPYESVFQTPVMTVETSTARTCPRCGASTTAAVCPACGEPRPEGSRRQPKQIRCRHCRHVASSELTICPGCGRELKPSLPLLATWGSVTAVTVLALLVLIPAVGAIRPGQWLRTQFSSGLSMAVSFGEQLEPEVVIVMTPIAEDAAEDAVEIAADEKVEETAEPTPAASDGEPQVVALASVEAPAVVVTLPTPTETPLSTLVPTEASAETAGLAADAVLPTATLTLVPTEIPVSTPSPTPRPEGARTATPVQVVVASGAGVAAQVEQAAASPTPTWTALPTATTPTLLPTPTLTTGIGGAVGAIAVAAVAPAESSAPTETPTFTPTPQVHQIKPGDTLVTIAARYGVSVAAIMAANGIAAQDVYAIQPGQVLTIPAANAPSTAATPVATRAATAPAEVSTAVRLDAPVLVSPETGTPMSCGGQTTLVWSRVQFIRDDDKYVLHLGFVSGRQENGEDIVTWVLAQPRPATQTSWDLDASLCGLAAQSFGRQWRWWVEVVAEVEGETVSVSPPSSVWGFGWN